MSEEATLFYDFPKIVHLDDILAAIKDRDEFVVADKGDHIIVNYNVGFADTFPEIYKSDTKEEKNLKALRREARGIVFNKETGRVISRRFSKFFNVGERSSTEIQNIDITQPHIILEKLDGSMITALLLSGEVRWGTKMGLTDTAANAEAFVQANPKYEKFAIGMIDAGKTPIFEWMSRKNRIVVDYKDDNLVLTAIRNNQDGNYTLYPEMVKLGNAAGIDVVRALPGNIENMESFMEEVRDLEGSEGYVLRFDNGHMTKMKSSWYIGLHKTKDALSQEKNVLRLVIENSIDDLKSLMAPDDIIRLDNYNDAVWKSIDATASIIQTAVDKAEADINNREWSMFENPEAEQQKVFAQEHALCQNKLIGQLMFRVRGGIEARDAVVDAISNNLSNATKVDNARSLHNTDWFDFYHE